MAYQTQNIGLDQGSGKQIEECLDRLLQMQGPRCKRLWDYYANPMTPLSLEAGDSGLGKPYVQGQEWGLPSRITGLSRASGSAQWQRLAQGTKRKEVVIENDIGWRINTMVEYLFGREIGIESAASDPARQQLLTKVLRRVLENHGGTVFLQQMALIGLVYGFVDVVVKLNTSRLVRAVPETVDAPPPPRDWADAGEEGRGGVGEGAGGSEGALPLPSSDGGNETLDVEKIAGLIRLEIVEPSRAMPILCETDCRTVRAYAQVWQETDGTGDIPAPGRRGFISRLLAGNWADRLRIGTGDRRATVMEIISPTRWQRYRDGVLIDEGENSLGRIPLVHIQNLVMPFSYSGASEVEPLIPLQDELNTRMSDRANRITLQSFKMYLGKGIDGFLEMPVSPGRMWSTDNDAASVQEFGGDANCPSEDGHIADIREAMDKASSVTAIAAGSIKDRIGNLTSAAALRITLMALLSKNERKRASYGAGVRQMCELVLAWLDASGALATTPAEREVNLYWPDPLPGDQMQAVQEAQAKLNLGVPKEVVLKELGY